MSLSLLNRSVITDPKANSLLTLYFKHKSFIVSIFCSIMFIFKANILHFDEPSIEERHLHRLGFLAVIHSSLCYRRLLAGQPLRTCGYRTGTHLLYSIVRHRYQVCHYTIYPKIALDIRFKESECIKDSSSKSKSSCKPSQNFAEFPK